MWKVVTLWHSPLLLPRPLGDMLRMYFAVWYPYVVRVGESAPRWEGMKPASVRTLWG